MTMVLNYGGDLVSQNDVGSKVDPEHHGTNPGDMTLFLESRGYVVYDFDRHTLRSIGGGHFRVVVGYDEENVYTIDPHYGSRTFSVESFLQYWGSIHEYGLIVIGDPTKDSDGDQLTDSDEVKQNTDLFYTEKALASTDETCRHKDVFDISENVYVSGRGYSPSTTYSLYIIRDTTLTDGMDIPARVPETETIVTTDCAGRIIQGTIAWHRSLTPGKYDIIVDVNWNGRYDAGVDAIDDDDIEVTVGFFVIPELPLGTIMALVSMMAGLLLHTKRPTIKK